VVNFDQPASYSVSILDYLLGVSHDSSHHDFSATKLCSGFETAFSGVFDIAVIYLC